MVELISGITFGMVVGQYFILWRLIRRVGDAEDRIRVLTFENKELAGRLDDIQRPELRH